MKLVTNEDLAVGELKKEYLEPRALPMSVPEFETWSDRIIGVTTATGLTATARSQKWALASMLLHIGETEDFKPDAYFIKSLRTAAVKQVANDRFMAIKAEQEAEKKEQLREATPITPVMSADSDKTIA